MHRALLRFSARRCPLSVASLCALLVAVGAFCCVPAALTGCNRAVAGSTIATASPRAMDSARQQMELIPPPSKTRFMAVHSLADWENPYMTVQESMVTLHVTLADANQSDLGVGGMLRPVGARRQDLNVRVGELPEALA